MKRRFFIIITAVLFVLVSVSMSACGASGEIMSLEDAYEAGWFTQDDLKSIAYYYCGYEEEGFEPAPKVPAELSEETKTQIEAAYRKWPSRIGKIQSVHIYEYCGTYNGCVVAQISAVYYNVDVEPWVRDEVIGGVMFYGYYWLYAWRA